MAASPREIRSLTGLRGIAACYVMLYHFSLGSLSGLARRAVQHGYLSVDLFFVLSGFVMALTYASRFQRVPTTHSYFDFLQKRFARVYPLYLLITLLMALVIREHLMSGTWPSMWNLGANLVLLQALGLTDSICLPSWSISTEFVAYFLFPVFAGTIVFGQRLWRWVALLSGLATLYVVAGLSSAQLHEAFRADARNGLLDVYAPGTLYPLLRCIAGFSMGVAVFSLVRGHAFAGRFWGVVTDVLIVSTLAALLLNNSDVAVVMLYVPLVGLLSLERGYAVKLLNTRVVHWLGLVSYSIYMDHFFLHQFFNDRLRHLLESAGVPHAALVRGATLILATLCVAALTYYFIEKPARDWFRRTPTKRHGTTSDAVLAAEPSAP